MAAVKSLFTFACRIGYMQFNVAHVYKLPKIKKNLSQKIISERDVIRLLDKEKSLRNHTLLRFLYVSGARVSEACGLRWRDLQEREKAEHGIAGQVRLHGKGGETRVVPLTAGVWEELKLLKGTHHNANYDAILEAPVFVSKSGRPLRRGAVFRIVQAAGKRAGLKGLSPHWLRHAHCSHAMDNEAPAHLVQRDAGHESLATTSKYTHARPDDTSARFLPVQLGHVQPRAFLRRVMHLKALR
jgi:site-specific recombinase XerD